MLAKPPLAQLAGSLLVQVPSFFVSRTLYAALKATRSRHFVIFDID